MFAFSLDRDGLNLAVQRAMQLHFDVADALHEQVTTGQQFVSVTVVGESDANLGGGMMHFEFGKDRLARSHPLQRA